MTTRLDRLVLLLDTGSTPTVRSTAAIQIGQVQKQHPQELYPLLSRVMVHLYSKQWETRIAAGLAIKAIVSQVDQWDPNSLSPEEVAPIEGLLSFENLDLNVVLRKGRPLLSSAGKEFDVDLSGLDPKERLQMQKKILRERLGLGTQFMDVDFFDENDVKIEAQKPETKADVTEVTDPFAGMSARERNQMKRKMRMKKTSSVDVSSSNKRIKVEEEPGKTVVQFKPKPEVSSLGVFSTGDEWPFEGLCEQLSFDLFSPNWETRHGAALGILHLMNIHGNGYGRIVGVTKKLNDVRHQQCLEDLCIRLLCVLALDQFADFVGDQAVVPVRETCAQALGTALGYCDVSLCVQVVELGLLKLVEFQEEQIPSPITAPPKKGKGKKGKVKEVTEEVTPCGGNRWAARLSALIGLKYTMAVRKDILDRILIDPNGGESRSFKAIVDGLKDSSDDVRAVASSALIPISDKMVELLPVRKIFDTIIVCLWDCLQELDDLTAATAFVMDLLADLIKKPPLQALLKAEADRFLEKLIFELFPFCRHALTSVRISVLNTLLTIAELGNESHNGCKWVSIDLIRLLFQNFMLEEKENVLDLTTVLFSKICDLLTNEHVYVDSIVEMNNSTLSVLLALFMSRIGKPVEERLFISYMSKSTGTASARAVFRGLNIPPQDRAMMAQDLTVINYDNVIHGRLGAAQAIGKIIGLLCSHRAVSGESQKVLELLKAYLMSGLGIHRVFAGLAISFWMKNENLSTLFERIPQAKELQESMMSVLNSANSGGGLLYVELQDHLRLLYQDCIAIRQALTAKGHVTPSIPPLASSTGANIFTIDSADFYLEKIVEPLLDNSDSSLSDLYRHTLQAKTVTRDVEKTLNTRVYSALASAVVSMHELPPKLNPIIRNLMACVQFESNAELQKIGCFSVAEMLWLNIKENARLNTNDKIVRNTCVYLCSDVREVGVARDIGEAYGIVTMVKLKTIKMPAKVKGRKKALEVDSAATEAVAEAGKAQANEQELIAVAILHRGAEFVLEALCKQFGPDIFKSVPELWSIVSNCLTEVQSSIVDERLILSPADPNTQRLIDGLHVLEVICRYIDVEAGKAFLGLIPKIVNCLTCPLEIVRHLASRCIASLGKEIKVPAMIQIIDTVVPLTNRFTTDFDRQGAVEALYHIVELLDDDVIPYLIFLMAPLLGRMSDPHEEIRFIATNAFAQLVKLAPLESGVPNPPEFTDELIEKKNTERQFIGQLIGSEKVQEYNIPVEIAAELRSYQKEGVSWLAFLNRYGLHGILCDDMGLGKTLQSICIIASDHFHRKKRFEETKSADFAHCPTLVVCPSPLTGHWFFEIKKYASFMNSVIYVGDKTTREGIQKVMMSYDVVITSYEVLRNDFDYFTRKRFNYCLLDEGHVIKNPNTKLTKAVKSIKAFHRLILSGTPVQNNVLDLWSLFDFLMPGFLGTEAQFNEKFGKPILASRDAKASSSEQEKGALALEALHKQVLPFLMRRMKEDVLEDLPPKIIQDYYCELSDVQKMLYEDFSLGSQDSDEKKGQHIFQALQYLRKLCNHPKFVLTENHPQYEKVTAKLRSEKRSINDIKNAPKLEALQQILLDCGIGAEQTDTTEATAPHRVLIFAQVKQMLDEVQNELFKKLMPSVTYMRLDGSISDPVKRHELIETFNQDASIDCLLLTTHVGGLGLNLTGADTVIFLEHDWNPSKDLQAMDRAHRIGQKRVVNVYRLITKGTLEEKIMGLQKFKLNLSSSIINSDNSGIQSMDTSQILDLFSSEGKEKDSDKNRAMTSKEAIESLGKLWDEDQYDDLAVDDFLLNLRKKH